MLRRLLLYAMCLAVGLCTACKDNDEELEPVDETPIVVPDDFTATFGPGGISILGNSISTYVDIIPRGYANFYVSQFSVNEVWWEKLAWLMQKNINSNASWSGSTVANIGKDDPNSYFSADQRINALANYGAPEYIFIAGGTNDWAGGMCELGNADSQPIDSTTFAGAYALMLEKIQSRYPATKVVCLSIFPRSQPFSASNERGQKMSDFNRIINSVATRYGCVYIDVTRCGMERDIARYTLDGVHPSELGMTLIARAIYEKLKIEN